MKFFRTYLLWTFYSAGSLLLSLWIAWHLFAQVNFLYPIWYSALSIDKTIEQTMPRHLYKKEFIATDKSEHHRLFASLVSSIQNQGEGLDSIYFYSPGGERLGKLLTESEITHLKDVSLLVSLLGWFSVAVSIFCLITLAAIFFFRVPMPKNKKLFISVVSVLATGIIAILLIGAKTFFYWAHTVVFPRNHQWFFYYEESLMSTLMKAPVLFAPISIQLLLLALLIWFLHLVLLRRMGSFKSI